MNAPSWKSLTPQRLLQASVVVALVTIVLKTAAWYITDSVGLLSDAMESLVNLASAIFALMILAMLEAVRSVIMQRIAAPMVGGMITAPLLSMFVIPAAYKLMRGRIKRFFQPLQANQGAI